MMLMKNDLLHNLNTTTIGAFVGTVAFTIASQRMWVDEGQFYMHIKTLTHQSRQLGNWPWYEQILVPADMFRHDGLLYFLCISLL